MQACATPAPEFFSEFALQYSAEPLPGTHSNDDMQRL
jgi:hypothetical protein